MTNTDSLGLTLYPTSDAPSLDGMTREEKIEAMVEWFSANFEDPAQETPYISAEGGYQYIWGGPYDASEELYDAFGSEADDETVAAAVERIESDGLLDWAPSGRRIRPEYEEGQDDSGEDDSGVLAGEVVDGDGEWPPAIAVPARPRPRVLSQEEVIARLDALEAGLQRLAEATPPIGHNNPPEPISDPPPLTPEVQQELRSDVQTVRAEVQSATPNIELIEKKAGIFRRIAAKVGKWLAELASKASVKIAETAVIAFAVKFYPEIQHLLVSAYDAILNWLPLPF